MTRRLEAGPPGGSSTLEDAQAVAANNAWRERQPQVEVRVPLVLAGPALVPFTTMVTTDLAGGEYKLDVVFIASGTNSGTRISIRFELDGFLDPDIWVDFSFGGSTARIPFAGSISIVIPPGVHTLIGLVSQPASPGTATALMGVMQLERVA